MKEIFKEIQKKHPYCDDWQVNRVNLILSLYGEDYFKNKKILELGPFNGVIGAYFSELGAEVHCLEGRQENVDNIKNNFPKLNAKQQNLDSPDWEFGHYDIIINFGLYYHLEKYHKEHLINCIKNCNLMFFETVIYDSYEDEIFFREETGPDQSVSNIGGNPSTSHVENIFKKQKVKFTKYTNPELNSSGHHYDWVDTGKKVLDPWARRFWIVENK